MKRKPSVYLDTSFVSTMHYVGRDLECQFRRGCSREWWTEERKHFDVVTSKITQKELAAGEYLRQKQALAEISKVRFLQSSKEVIDVANVLLDLAVVPRNKPYDAMQLAFCIQYEIEYLLSWNFAHLANPEVQRILERKSRDFRWFVPLLVTPESIPQVRFGADLRREKK